MDVKEKNIAGGRTVTTTVPAATKTMTLSQPTVVITQMASKEYLKISELAEYCRIAHYTLKECETKIQILASARNETARLKIEYLTRDKVNITNHESLLQAKNELFQYRCELKSKYVAIEKAVKTKKLRYEKLISSYESDWQKALGEYALNPLMVELKEIQRTNAQVEKNIESQEKLNVSTEAQMLELQRDIRKKFLNIILEFSQVMIQYKKFIILERIRRAKNEVPPTPQENQRMKFSKSVMPVFSKPGSFNGEDANTLSGVDVSVFDELMVPTENLEAENEEEELFNFIHDQNMQMGDENVDQEGSTEMIVNDDHQSVDRDETQINGVGSAKQNLEKPPREENESQYFRNQAPDCLKQGTVQSTTAENWGLVTENLNDCGNKKFNENSLPSTGISKGNNEKIYREDNIEINRQTESEKSLSEASYYNQNIYSREAFDYGYNKAHSVSSEDMPLSGENTNESFGSPHKIMNTDQTNIFKLQDGQEREELKSFGDFFAINSDKNSEKPSIFKLF